jgi:peptide methionine sulfoxide reductase MsrA
MKQERSILAGGCFWGMRDLIRDSELIRTERGAGYVFAASAEIAR